MKEYLQLTFVTDEQLKKIHQDLKFIDLISKAAKKKNMRVIVHGGYAVDGLLQKITRPHNDIDLGIWGNNLDPIKVFSELLEEIGNGNIEFTKLKLEDEGRHEWTHQVKARNGNFLAEMYYAEVRSDPFSREKVIVKKDGTNEIQNHETSIVTLEGVTFEATSPLLAIVDRLYKQKRGDGVKSYHTQDIKNLQLITDEEEVNKRLKTYHGG